MNLYDSPEAWQDNVRASRQVTDKKAVPELGGVKHPPDSYLRLSISTLDRRNVPASGYRNMLRGEGRPRFHYLCPLNAIRRSRGPLAR